MDALIDVQLFELADENDCNGTLIGPGRAQAAMLRRGELIYQDGVEYEIKHVLRGEVDPEGSTGAPRVYVARTVVTSPPNPILRFVIGKLFMTEGQFQIFHGQRNVTELFDVKKMRFEIDADARGRKAMTRVHLELLAEVEIEGEAELEGYMREQNRVRTALGLDPLPCDHSTGRTRYVGCGGKAFWICDGCEQVVTRAEREWWPDSAEARATQYGLQRYQLRVGFQGLGQGWFHPSAVEVGKEIYAGARGWFLVEKVKPADKPGGVAVVSLRPLPIFDPDDVASLPDATPMQRPSESKE